MNRKFRLLGIGGSIFVILVIALVAKVQFSQGVSAQPYFSLDTPPSSKYVKKPSSPSTFGKKFGEPSSRAPLQYSSKGARKFKFFSRPPSGKISKPFPSSQPVSGKSKKKFGPSPSSKYVKKPSSLPTFGKFKKKFGPSSESPLRRPKNYRPLPARLCKKLAPRFYEPRFKKFRLQCLR